MIGGSSHRGIPLNSSLIRDLRRNRGKTQETLAAAAGISVDAVSRAERRIPISLENATSIASTLGVDIATLIVEEDNRALIDTARSVRTPPQNISPKLGQVSAQVAVVDKPQEKPILIAATSDAAKQ